MLPDPDSRPAAIPGQIVVLNGAPRSGKSSIVTAIQELSPELWLNLGVDTFVRSATPQRFRPGIGLRPGGERPDLESLVCRLWAAMYDSIAAHSRLGLNVAVDVGHHDDYSRPLGILHDSAVHLRGLPVLFVGVRCPVDVIMERRNAGQPGREGGYVTGSPADPIPAPVLRWQEAVHVPGLYDLEVDTSKLKPEECARLILDRLATGPPGSAFESIAKEKAAQRE